MKTTKIWLIPILVMLSGLFTKIFGQTPAAPKSLWEQALLKKDPTKPINFGYKWVWAAVRTADTDSVLSMLNLSSLEKSDWVNGAKKGDLNYVFVLPPIDGWTLISGWGLPVPDHAKEIERSKKLLNRLSEKFGEAQLFGNHSASNAAFWMKSVKGAVVRLYSVGDGQGFIEGTPTKVEEQWDLIDPNSEAAKHEDYWEKMVFPDAEHVLIVAENWSINPMKLEEYENVGAFGYTGILPR